jgi:SRP54-type protein, GTPase domain
VLPAGYLCGHEVDPPLLQVLARYPSTNIGGALLACRGAFACTCVQVDSDMMTELVNIKKEVTPTDTLLVVDAMTGQEAAQLTKAFDDAVDVTGECFLLIYSRLSVSRSLCVQSVPA